MRISSPAGRRKARIEIVPLIDIVFFLLATFVMVSMSMVQNQGVGVRLPSAATSASEDRRASATVSVTESGDIYLNKDVVTLEDLKGRLKAMKASDPELKVFINGDERASFGRAVELLDQIRSLGIVKVAIQTKSKK